MVQVDLTKTELFKSFCEIEVDALYVDLHNAFDCYDISYLNSLEQLSIKFKSNKYNNSKTNHVELIFKSVVMEVMNFKVESNLNPWTVSIMYRGRCDAENESLAEMTADGKYYYCLDFYDDYAFELRASSVIAILKQNEESAS